MLSKLMSLFKKETKVEVISNELEITKIQSDYKYPPIIQQIHSEFRSAGDNLYREALEILQGINIKTEDQLKVDKLKSLGFIQTKQVKEIESEILKSKLAKQKAELIQYYKLNYPLNKFIDEKTVETICKKYNLVHGNVNMYTGFVPQKNLDEIAKFKIKEENYIYQVKYGISFSSSWNDITYTEYVEINKENDIKFKDARFINVSRINLFITRKLKRSLSICAPLKDMEMKNMRISEDGYTVSKIEIPDPVVLHKVNGGYLIVTAWGDEQNDPMIFNEKLN